MRKIAYPLLAVIALTIMSCGGRKFPYQALVRTEANAGLLIQNVRIFDGQSEALSPPSDVYVAKGRIVQIQASGSSLSAPTVIDGSGKILMPGLIDTHVHLGGSGSAPWAPVKAHIPYNLEAYLYAGITTVYELGGFAPKAKKLRRQIVNGKIAGPYIYYTHMPVTVEGSHPIPLGAAISPWPLNKIGPKLIPTIEKPEEAAEIAAKYKKMGVDYLKIICDKIPPTAPEMDAQLVAALVKAGHAEGMKVFVHVGSASNALAAVRAGADVLAHGIWRSPLTDAEAKEIAASGIPIIYTLAGFENVHAVHQGNFQPTEIDRLLIPAEVLDPLQGKAGAKIDSTPVIGAFAQCVHDQHGHWKENFAKLRAAGAKILVGTDSALPGTWPGATYYQEIHLLKEYGMTNLEILRGATGDAAGLISPDANFGVVKEGAWADLLLLDENPLMDLKALEKPALILARGKVVTRLK